MIRSLRIQNLATIKDIDILFDRGFTILTGETGAGKSIIIDGLKLVLGERCSTDLIRTGQDELSVEAVFELAGEATAVKKEFPESGPEMFIQRRLKRKGPARGYIEGTLVPQSTLGSVGNHLVDIYGQNDHIFLRRSDYQRDYLDSFAGAETLRRETESACRSLKKLDKERQRLIDRDRERERRLDFLNFQINEIESAGLITGEEEELRRERDILTNKERVQALVNEALDIAADGDLSLLARLKRLRKITESLGAFNEEFKDMTGSISDFEILLKDYEDSLLRFGGKYDEAPDQLDQLEERLSIIEKLKRKYGHSVQEVLESLATAKAEYHDLNSSKEKLTELQGRIADLFASLQSLCRRLTDLRTRGARELEKRARTETGQLGMSKAVFRIELKTTPPGLDDPTTWKESGNEDVDFLISLNPGESPKSLGKIASGGELSRIMLALKSISRIDDRDKTLIFDEIDTGIGGQAAEFVAQKLRMLAQTHQVICITHLPQIASFAEHHFRIEKNVRDGHTFTDVKKLGFEERVSEIAQLLSGSRITEAALKNARDMLEFSESGNRPQKERIKEKTS